jgi:hypothetical protein
MLCISHSFRFTRYLPLYFFGHYYYAYTMVSGWRVWVLAVHGRFIHVHIAPGGGCHYFISELPF